MKKKREIVYAFIDSQNLNLGTSKDIYRGKKRTYESLYNQLRSYGYKIVFKPTVKDKQGKPKGNIDAELVLHAAAIEYQKYDKAVIVSGDGDFYCLHKYLEKNKKLFRIIIPNEKSESSLLKPFQKYKTFITFERGKLELKQ